MAAVWKRADALGVSYADVAVKSDDEVYLLSFPDKFRKETVYAPVNYEYVHNELKMTGVLWHEYEDSAKDGVPVGCTKFCDDYGKYVEQNDLTNHITHKPGVVCEVDWSGRTMRLNDSKEGKVHPVYLIVAALVKACVQCIVPYACATNARHKNISAFAIFPFAGSFVGARIMKKAKVLNTQHHRGR